MDPFLTIPAAKRVVVIGDIHGDLQRLVKCMFAANLINTRLEWVAEPADTILVQLGDQVDSLNRGGPDLWEKMVDTEVIRFMDSVRQSAEKRGGRVISLLGNHELMNVAGNFIYVSKNSLEKSGGEEGRLNQYRPGSILCTQILSQRPVLCKIGSILFCHAGLLPEHVLMMRTLPPLVSINQVVQRYLLGHVLSPAESNVMEQVVLDLEGIVWTRKYHESPQTTRLTLELMLRMMDAKCLIVGHTPHNNVTSVFDGKLWYADVGISRAFGSDHYQVLEIWDDGHPLESNSFTPIRTITVMEKN